MDREAWHAAVHGVAKSSTQLSDWTELKRIELFPFLLLLFHYLPTSNKSISYRYLVEISCQETSLMVQWLSVCLPVQGTWVRSLVRKDLTCHRTTKPVHHNYRACALEPGLCNRRSRHSETPRTTTRGRPHSLQPKTVHAQQRRPSTAKDKQIKSLNICHFFEEGTWSPGSLKISIVVSWQARC